MIWSIVPSRPVMPCARATERLDQTLGILLLELTLQGVHHTDHGAVAFRRKEGSVGTRLPAANDPVLAEHDSAQRALDKKSFDVLGRCAPERTVKCGFLRRQRLG